MKRFFTLFSCFVGKMACLQRLLVFMTVHDKVVIGSFLSHIPFGESARQLRVGFAYRFANNRVIQTP